MAATLELAADERVEAEDEQTDGGKDAHDKAGDGAIIHPRLTVGMRCPDIEMKRALVHDSDVGD